VLIPSLYATSPRTRYLRPIRVPSDQNTRWRLPYHLSLLRDKEFLVSPYLPDIYIPPYIRGWTIAATSLTCDNVFGVLIPSLYATSPRTRSLRPVRVPSDQNTRWRLPFYFSTNKRREFLVSPHLPY